MRPLTTLRLATALLLVLSVGFSACIKDACKQEYAYTFYRPVYKTKTAVRENIKSNAVRTVEQPGKLNIRGSYIFLNEVDKGVHVIDNSNPAAPAKVAFIDIPGNVDIAVKGNILYADLYTDLVAIDITNPANAKLVGIQENIFPDRIYSNGFYASMNSEYIISEWIKVDTVVASDCNNGGRWFGWGTADVFFSAASSQSNVSVSPVGVGGSMARFTIMSDWLYTINTTELDVFSIAKPEQPVLKNTVNIGWGIETIFPFKNRLFVGSRTGMYIYNVSNPSQPAAAGQFNHVQSCDPVIADDNYAYVTLRSGNTCQGFTNQLDIVKLNNFTDPKLEKTYQMSNPHGLSKDGNTLFICDGAAGLKVYNAADVQNLQLITTIEGIETFDVIAMNGVALVVTKDGLYQYDYTNLKQIKLLSKINVSLQ